MGVDIDVYSSNTYTIATVPPELQVRI